MPKTMGPRPADFDEMRLRRAPKFQEWMKLQPGQAFRYAGRDYVKGYKDDEERLMRRIMITRRNNLENQEEWVNARANQTEGANLMPPPFVSLQSSSGTAVSSERFETQHVQPKNAAVSGVKSIGGSYRTNDDFINEMDVVAVEATRSYKKWLSLPNGSIFPYNAKSYVKGQEGRDWTLKKDIWGRIAKRRREKVIVEKARARTTSYTASSSAAVAAAAAAATVTGV